MRDDPSGQPTAEQLRKRLARLEESNRQLIAALERAEGERARLEALTADQRGILKAMRDVVLVLDSEGRYVDVPATAPDLLYRPEADLIGKPMRDVMPAEVAENFLGVIREVLETGQPARYEYPLPIGDRSVWFAATVSRMDPLRVVWVARDVTAQREAESAVRASEERYRLLFESSPMPMWVYDLNTLEFLAVNEAAVRQYGFTEEEFLGMTVADIRPPENVPELIEAVAQAPRKLHRSGVWVHRAKDGTRMEVDLAAHPIEFEGRPAELVLSHDVTAQRRAEADLRRKTEFLRAVVDDSPLAIVSADLALKITRWNAAAESLLGWSASEIVGRSFLTIVPGHVREEHRAAREAAIHGGAVRTFETRRLRKDGSEVDVAVSLGALHGEAGTVTGFVGIIADITERKRLERRLSGSEKLQAVGQLAGGVAHDFNNVLTAIGSYSQLVLDDMQAGDARRSDVLEIRRAAERAGSLTRQLLAFSRQQVVQAQVLSLNDVVVETENMLRRLVREDVLFTLSLDPELGFIEADPGQIGQVLVNLVVNARDAMPTGGSILIETSNSDPGDAPSGPTGEAAEKSHVVLAVSDTGVGMTSEVQQRMFEPFFTTKEAGRGTGLGLATVYGIIQEAGGHISVYSEPGGGTRFRILFPRSDAPVAAPAKAEAAATAGARDGETIVLVEDDAAVREVSRRILAGRGYTVLEAKTGKEALEMIRSRNGSVDMMLTDMVMPELSGPDLAALVRSEYPDLPIMFMSGYSRDAAQQLHRFETGTAYVEKPFTPAQLARRVRRLIDHVEGR